MTALRPLDHLYAAAADPQVARILGLMTTDTVDPGGIYDYLVHCNVPQPWVQWSLAPAEARSRRPQDAARGPPWRRHRGMTSASPWRPGWS